MLDSIIFIIVSARLLIGWALDMIFGDPTWLPHPVVWMGKWIAMGERMLNKGRWRMTKGAIFAVGSIMLTYLLVHALLITIEHFIEQSYSRDRTYCTRHGTYLCSIHACQRHTHLLLPCRKDTSQGSEDGV